MKKIFHIPAVLALVAALLAGCGQKTAPGQTLGQTEDSGPAASAGPDAQAGEEQMEPGVFRSGQGVLNYLLYIPENPEGDMPLIVYLHGNSGKGETLQALTESGGFPRYLATGALGQVDGYVLIPQLPDRYSGWGEVRDQLMDCIGQIEADYAIDSSRISLTGHSMGGTGVWNLAIAYPDRFSCIVPLSGSVRTTERNLTALAGMHIWAFAGGADEVVPPEPAQAFVEALDSPQAKMTVIGEAGHEDVPALVYLSEEYGVVDWMLSGGA